MKKPIGWLLSLSILLGSVAAAFGQGPSGGGPGPQPAPSPWIVSGATISYNNGGITMPSTVTGGTKGVGTINLSGGYYVNGAPIAPTSGGALGAVLRGQGATVAPAWSTAIYPNTVTSNRLLYASATNVVSDLASGNNGVLVTSAGGVPSISSTLPSGLTIPAPVITGSFTATGLVTNADLVSPSITVNGTTCTLGSSCTPSGAGGITALTGDGTATGPGSVAFTLATVNSNVGSFGSATQVGTFTVNGKGLLTAAANVTVTPAVGSITGLGTGVATALGVNVGSAGAFVTFNGAGGTPSSMVGTNITGTAAGLTAGNVTTNANLTGPITSVGNATSIASQTGTGTKFVVDAGPTISALVVTGSFTATGLVTNAALANPATTVNGQTCTLGSTCTVAAAAGTLTGATLAAGVTASSLTSVGALAGGSATTGFTINAANVTWSGQIPGASVAVVANASGSPSATFGVMKADGTTIQCTSGICSAVGGVATNIQVGVTTVTSGSPPALLANVAGVLQEYTVATATQFATGTANKIVDAAVAVSAALPSALSAGATVTPDLNAAINFTLTPNQNFTLANPSNITGKEGRSFCVAITNDSTPRTITWGTSYYGPGGSANLTLTASASAKDNYCMFIVSTTVIYVVQAKNFSH